MSIRNPVAAGRFYPLQPSALQKEVRHYLSLSADQKQDTHAGKKPWAFMLPHAGYIFSGEVTGKTLCGQDLPPRLIILCPNHTGRGYALGVWSYGEWITPLGSLKIDSQLAENVLQSDEIFQSDTQSHIVEHSIEVILPFLQEINPNISIVPICVGTRNPQILERAGKDIAKVLKMPKNSDVGLIISSDMNHYENEKTTFEKDELALAQARAADPDALLKVVQDNGITMCGAAPMSLALYAAKELGGADVELVAHATSGTASGDFNRTVGYAGLRIFLKAC